MGSGTVTVTGDTGDSQCIHLWDVVLKASDKSQGFDDAPNHGGVYKVRINWKDDNWKNDNFKVGTEGPTITCPDNISLACEGGNGAHVTFPPAEASDGKEPYTFVYTIESDQGTKEVNSGDLFPPGITIVTAIVTDASGQMDLCKFTIEVTGDCRNACVPTCPAPITPQCNDPSQCYATVTWLQPAPIGTCREVCDHSSGEQFPVGKTTVTCTTTDPTGYINICRFDIIVNDCEPPAITCPAGVSKCLETVNGTILDPGKATATDNCTPVDQIMITWVRSDDKTQLTDPFPLGTTTITWTATDKALNSASCVQTITIKGGGICAVKFYDANANGINDDGKFVTGWKMTLAGYDSAGNVVPAQTKFTDGTGVACFKDLPLGTYRVAEVLPNTKWVAKTPTTVPVVLNQCSDLVTVEFGNLCLGAGGGLTLGFWSNNNGRALFGADDLALMVSLNLRNANGSVFDPGNYSAFKSWLLSANANNMANMLSAQLAAMELNVLNGMVNGLSLVYVNGCGGFMTVNDLMAAANTELGLHGCTPFGGSYRAYQECLKNALDRANNNLTFVQPTPCSFTSPY